MTANRTNAAAPSGPGQPMPEHVHALLDAMLSREDPHHLALRAQLPHLWSEPGCGCGCLTVNFGHDDRAPAAHHPDPDAFRASGGIVAEAGIVTADGEFPGEILLFVRDGYLSWLEFCTWGDENLTVPPTPDQLRVTHR